MPVTNRTVLDAERFGRNTRTGNRTAIEENGFLRHDGRAAGYDDMRFPFIGRNIDTSSGRIDYDYTELGISFATNARYAATEQVSMICQMQHRWRLGSPLYPHVHWIQEEDNIPNWLLVYRLYDNGEVPTAWIEAKYTSHSFAYTEAGMLQITNFPVIDATSLTSVSAFIDFKFYRDAGNTSTLFDGADPYTVDAVAKEFDVHYIIDTPAGSRQEYVK